MKYMGSKSRIAKNIIPIMLSERKNGQTFYDVCCGGSNIVDKITEGKRVAIDNDLPLIECMKLIRDDPSSLPKCKEDVTEEQYKEMKNSSNLALQGYYGYALSYGGKWFGGYRRDKIGKRDYIAESYRGAVKQSPNLQGVEFVCSHYKDVEYDEKSLVYIDPPYKHTTTYKNKFDHDSFWSWCEDMGHQGHTVFVSEYYTLSSKFASVWKRTINSSLTKDTGDKQGVEQLFKYTG